jgi:hypothetical protein
MAYQLSSLIPARGETQPENDVVQTSLQTNQEILASDTSSLGSTPEEIAELTLLEAIHPFHLLLLSKLEGIVGLFPSAGLSGSMLAWGIGSPVHWTFLGVALLALQEQLLPFPAAELTDWSSVSSHRDLSLLEESLETTARNSRRVPSQ